MGTRTQLRRPAGLALLVLVAFLPHQAGARAGLAVTTNSHLGFGRIVVTGSAGTVTVSPSGFRSSSGGVVLAGAAGATAGSFTVGGDPDAGYTVTLPNTCVLSGGSGSMTVESFVSGPAPGRYLLGPGGTATFTVGATLRVGAGQSPGAYSGTYEITVAYE